MNSASLNEISHNILNSLRGGRTSSEEHMSLEQIKYIVKYYRALFIRRDFQRNNNRSRMFEQDLGMLSVGSIDSAESPDEVSGNHVKRTTKQIPTPIRLKHNVAITHVGTKDKVAIPFSFLDDVRTPWQEFNKFTSKSPFVTYRNGYLYLTNISFSDSINVRGVFEDPEQVHKFTRENGFDLYDEDSPFPISIDMLEGITKGILSGELILMVETPSDTTTDKQQSA